MKILRLLIPLLLSLPFTLLIHNLNGQGTVQTQLNPDCPVVSIGLTLTSGSGATITVPGGNGFDNRVTGCQTYTLQYVATASSGSLTGITFQAAGGAAVPGTFSAFGGTVSTGINPNTSNTGAISTFTTGCTSSSACTIANAWLNVLITRGTFVGTIQLVVYGWKNGSAKAGSGGGGGGGNLTVAGTLNQITAIGAGCTPTNSGTCTIALANNTVLPGNPSTPGTMTAAGFISDEPFSGNVQLNGFTSGNVTLTVADVAGTAIAYMWPGTNGTAGQVLSDSGVATCPTLPAGAPTVCHQLAWIAAGGGGSGGGGVLGYSATALTLPTAGTTFLAPIGGALASTTEANVTANAPAAAAISNMYVTLSAAPGTGNTIAFTFRDAGSSTAVTCTISGASATSCQDATHSFTPVVGDALAVQVVTTGTVVIAPAIKIIAEYGVTGGGGGGTPGGSVGQWQANNAGSFGGLAGTSIIPQTGWTIRNAAVFNNFSSAQFGIFVLDNSSLNWRFITRALPSGSTYTIAGTIVCLATNPAVNTQTCDFGLSDGTKYENYEPFFQSGGSGGPDRLRIETITNVNTDGSTVFGITAGLTTLTSSFCVVEDGTHRTWSHYSNGAWVQDLQEATGTFLTPTLLDVGGLSASGGASNYLQVQFLYLYTATTTSCP